MEAGELAAGILRGASPVDGQSFGIALAGIGFDVASQGFFVVDSL
jgi:hypothetical protein